jgi:hypothetical protein
VGVSIRATRLTVAQQRDGESALVGFRNLEREGIFAFEILDPIPVRVHNGGLMAGSQRPASSARLAP